MKRPERVAAVGVQRSRTDGKAHTGHRNRTPAPHSHPNFDRVRVGFFFLIFEELPIFPAF